MAEANRPSGAPTKSVRRSPKLLLSLWSRTDLADSVVSFLPAKAIAGLALVSKPLLEAQPRVVFAAARRRNVAEKFTRACFEALATSDWHHFRETWTDGLARWTMPDSLLPHYRFGTAGTPPRLELERDGSGIHMGFYCLFSGSSERITRLRMQVALDSLEDNGAAGYAILARHSPGDSPADTGSGSYFSHVTDDDGEPTGELDLRWLMKDMQGINTSAALARNIRVGEMYTIDASYSYDSDGACTAHVSVNGQPAALFTGRMHTVNILQLYNFSGGLARYGDIDVWYE